MTAFAGEEHRAFTLQGGVAATVLVHGFPGTPDEMRPLATRLNQAGWTVYVPLLPGFGADIHSLNQRTMEEWLTAVQSALSDLRRDHSPLLLVGHSMGGALAIIAMSTVELSVEGLILLAPFYRIPHFLWTILPIIQAVIPQFKPFRLIKLDFNNPEMRAGILNFMPDLNLDDPATQAAIKGFAVPVSMINQLRRAGIQAYKRAKHVQAPVLVIQGRQDDLVRPSITRQLLPQFSVSPHYLEVDATHDLVRSDRPAWSQVAEAVVSFAGELASADRIRVNS